MLGHATNEVVNDTEAVLPIAVEVFAAVDGKPTDPLTTEVGRPGVTVAVGGFNVKEPPGKVPLMTVVAAELDAKGTPGRVTVEV